MKQFQIEFTGQSFAYDGAALQGTITNLTDSRHDFDVNIYFTGDSGLRLAAAKDFVPGLGAGETAMWRVLVQFPVYESFNIATDVRVR